MHKAYLAVDDDDKALEIIEKAYDASLRVFGEMDATTALMARNKGLVYKKRNEPCEAEKHLKQFINIFDEIHFPMTSVYTKTIEDLVCIYAEHRNTEEAVSLIERLVDRCSDLYKFETPARLYLYVGCKEKALQLLDDEYEYCMREYNDKHDYLSLAVVYKEAGDRTRALELLKISQNYYVSVHGAKNRRIERVIKEIELNMELIQKI